VDPGHPACAGAGTGVGAAAGGTGGGAAPAPTAGHKPPVADKGRYTPVPEALVAELRVEYGLRSVLGARVAVSIRSFASPFTASVYGFTCWCLGEGTWALLCRGVGVWAV
jgi:hypothetical protein